MWDSIPEKCFPLKLVKCESLKIPLYTCGFSVVRCACVCVWFCAHLYVHTWIKNPSQRSQGQCRLPAWIIWAKNLIPWHMPTTKAGSSLPKNCAKKIKLHRKTSVVQNQNTPASTALIQSTAWLWTSPLFSWSFGFRVSNKRNGPFKPMLFDSSPSLENCLGWDRLG